MADGRFKFYLHSQNFNDKTRLGYIYYPKLPPGDGTTKHF